VDIWSGVKLIF